jgi:hypothetical protein
MKYLKITQEMTQMRPQLRQVLGANGLDILADHWLVPETHADISFVLLNLEMIDQVEWVTDRRIKTLDNTIRAFV